MICSSTEVIQKAQALRQNFRSICPTTKIVKHPSINLPAKSYEFNYSRPAKSSNKISSYKLKSISPKESSPRSYQKSNYLRDKVLIIPSPKKYLNFLNSVIREENTVITLDESRKISKNKIKLSLHLPMCRPYTREAALSKSSKALNIFN